MTRQQKNTILQSSISILLMAGTGIVMLSSQVPIIRKVSEYSVHIMLGLLAFSMLAMALNRIKIMFAGLACTAAMCIFLKEASNNTLKLPVANTETKLNVAHINLGNITFDPSEIKQFLDEEQAEVVSFQELTPDWVNTLDEMLRDEYPYKKLEVRIDPYGMAMFSRHPFVEADTFLCGQKPSLSLSVLKDDQHFHLFSSYLTPALDKKSLASASKQLQTIASKIRSCKQPVIALGEFNMVYWTNEIREFRTSTALTNSRRGLSQGNLRVPYDHIFFSNGLECTTFKEVKDDNQNHIGIIGTYQVKDASKPATLNGQLSLSTNDE